MIEPGLGLAPEVGPAASPGRVAIVGDDGKDGGAGLLYVLNRKP